jgi:hypothetical protein
MKQGRATRDVNESSKTEPVSRGVNKSFVSDIGSQVIRPGGSVPMYEGRGLKAPMVSQKTSNKGSQGKY